MTVKTYRLRANKDFMWDGESSLLIHKDEIVECGRVKRKQLLEEGLVDELPKYRRRI